jgi:plastocyanin/peptidoglycan hydrolase-like protein with peptidoglycan-binding domain
MNTTSHKRLGMWAAGIITLFAPFVASAAQINISITDHTYTPKVASVNVGDTVRWTNNGTLAHSVKPDAGTFAERTMQPGESFSYTFTSAGTLAYHCAVHGAPNGVGMAGSIVVNGPVVVPVTPVATTPAAPTNPNVSGIQSDAEKLLAQVKALQEQLAKQSGTAGTSASAGAGTNPGACPNIGRVLKKGSTGDDVTRLQQFLARDTTVYPEGTVTGYYGALTEKAVQRWQTKYNIVSSGSPESTGYGVVGPRTAAAIALLCSTGGVSGGTSGNTGTPVVGGFIQVSPVSGYAPLKVNVVANLNTTNLCTGAMFTLSWGDGTASQQIPIAANNCSQVSQTYQHMYTQAGTYIVTLSSGTNQVTAPVTVYGSVTSTPAPTPTPTPAPTPTPTTYNPPAVTPLFGGNPYAVEVAFEYPYDKCNAYQLTWGDGTNSNPSASTLCTQSTNVGTFTATHTYSANGSYTITLTRGSQVNTTGVTISN